MVFSVEGLWREAALQHGSTPMEPGPSGGSAQRPGLQGKGRGEAGRSGTPRSVRCQKAADGADRGPWICEAAPVCAMERSRWAFPALQCRTLRAMVEELALPPDFGLLPWEFASAISWNMNLFIFKGEQT